VSTYAPQPYVSRFNSEGQLLGEFQIEGDAVDLQTGFATEFLNRRTLCSGGITVMTSATVDPATGHLWVAMNGLSTHGTVYEYDQTGTKLRELAFLLDSNNKRQNVTHVKDIAVSGDSLSLLTWGGAYNFKLSDVLIADAWKVPAKTSETRSTFGALANPLGGIATLWAPAPVSRPGIPQPLQSSCSGAQSFACQANCPTGTNPNPADCGAQIGAQFPTSQSKRITSNSCTAKPIDSTPGSSAPGGCSQTVTWCDTADPNITGSTTVNVNCNAVPTPTPTPEPTPNDCTATELGSPGDYGCYHCYDGDNPDCDEGTDFADPDCDFCVPSPIVVDVLGDGFNLTNLDKGVMFDIVGNGRPMRLSWIQGDDAWLVLDRNGNGTVDNGTELFGNFTPQNPSKKPHGFLALSEYDRPENGGNSDGKIDARDAVFASLRLWQETNGNGISELAELHTLPSLDVDSISLDYGESGRTDRYGNKFRYRAKVYDQRGSNIGRWAWDVFLVNRQ